MVNRYLSRRTVSTVTERWRTAAAYSRRQSATGWAADADGDSLELSAMAAAAV